ncbi:MAG: hypothetical protein DCF22_23640, partial [Leptolyngbya sp.]
MGIFGLTDNLKGQVQGLDAEPANVPAERQQITYASQTKLFNCRSNDLLGCGGNVLGLLFSIRETGLMERLI